MNPNDEPADRPTWELPPDLKSLEATISGLSPRDDRLDRERLAFLAGQASMSECGSSAGKWRRHPAWPAAFAAMSAVAASLLFVIVVRPENSEKHLPIAEFASSNFARQAGDRAEVLSAGDARFGDIESRLARYTSSRSESETIHSRPQKLQAPVLTPNAWHQVINQTETSEPSPDDATRISSSRGVNS